MAASIRAARAAPSRFSPPKLQPRAVGAGQIRFRISSAGRVGGSAACLPGFVLCSRQARKLLVPIFPLHSSKKPPNRQTVFGLWRYRAELGVLAAAAERQALASLLREAQLKDAPLARLPAAEAWDVLHGVEPSAVVPRPAGETLFRV